MRFAMLTVLALLGAGQAAVPPHLPPLDRLLPPRAEAVYTAVAGRVDPDAAMETVRFMSQYWRLAGNPGFEQSLAFIEARLTAGGFASRAAGATSRGARVSRVSYPNSGAGWEPGRARVTLAGDPTAEVLSTAQDRLALAINSFPTPAGGSRLRLVDARAGVADDDYEGLDVAGAVVLGDGPIGRVWAAAVQTRGAAGVISTEIADYTRPGETPGVLQWGSIPYDADRRSFGFKATARAARMLRRRLAAGPVTLAVEIASTFHPGDNQTLIAEIPGATLPDERVVLVAHVQEPGANDNASGSATLLAAVLALQEAIAAGTVPAPARTITALWGDEIRMSQQWIAADPARAGRVVAMMSLDMTGEDTARTGGTFLIEKSPDPSAVYERPSDPHSEWGAGEVDPAWVRGHFLNDLHLAVCLREARDTGWVVRTNPYEGGSDHTAFIRGGVPALLNWHFTDRFYHTNLDTVDKTSPVTMGHVARAVATTAGFLAAAGDADVAALVALVDEAERARLATERRNDASGEILAAWQAWYAEARASVETLRR